MQNSKNNREVDDKVDLTSVNTSQKGSKKITLPKLTKKQEGPFRDDEGKFATTTGGGGLKTLKTFNWKRAAPFIVVVALVGGVMVYQSFAGSTNLLRNKGRTSIRNRQNASQSSQVSGDILRTIYAKDILPLGYTVNDYAKERLAAEGNVVVPIKPFYSMTSGKWDKSWPNKIKICAILYNGGPTGEGVETTVKLNVGYQLETKQVLEKLPKLQTSGWWPKYELCSPVINKVRTLAATAGRPAITLPESKSYGAEPDVVSVKDINNDKNPINKTYKWDTSPNDYKVVVERYIVKKAQ